MPASDTSPDPVLLHPEPPEPPETEPLDCVTVDRVPNPERGGSSTSSVIDALNLY